MHSEVALVCIKRVRARMGANHDFAGEVRKFKLCLSRLLQREIGKPVVDKVNGAASTITPL